MRIRAEDSPLSPLGLQLDPTQAQAALAGGVDRLRALVREHAVVILRGLGDTFPDPQALSRFASQWGAVMPWSFGDVLELDEQASPNDSVFAHDRLPLHWDGMYRDATPEFMMLYCRRAPAQNEGGRTFVVDTRRVLARADAATVQRWKQIDVTYFKGGQVHYSGAAHSPLVARHPRSGEDVLRLEGPFHADAPLLNEPLRIWNGIAAADVAAFEQELVVQLRAEDCCLSHAWEAGDLMIADNFAVLHGREGFTSGSRRTLWRVQVHAEPMAFNPPVPERFAEPCPPPGTPVTCAGE